MAKRRWQRPKPASASPRSGSASATARPSSSTPFAGRSSGGAASLPSYPSPPSANTKRAAGWPGFPCAASSRRLSWPKTARSTGGCRKRSFWQVPRELPSFWPIPAILQAPFLTGSASGPSPRPVPTCAGCWTRPSSATSAPTARYPPWAGLPATAPASATSRCCARSPSSRPWPARASACWQRPAPLPARCGNSCAPGTSTASPSGLPAPCWTWPRKIWPERRPSGSVAGRIWPI